MPAGSGTWLYCHVADVPALRAIGILVAGLSSRADVADCQVYVQDGVMVNSRPLLLDAIEIAIEITRQMTGNDMEHKILVSQLQDSIRTCSNLHSMHECRCIGQHLFGRGASMQTRILCCWRGPLRWSNGHHGHVLQLLWMAQRVITAWEPIQSYSLFMASFSTPLPGMQVFFVL